MSNSTAPAIKPICFMIMPFNRKSTGAPAGKPAEIDFDALWNNAIEPALRELGYEPVRADQDLGAFIIKEMIERLALSDLVLAEISIPNGNVYYEIGVRHAAKQTGCVLVGADWAKPLFDINQMRQIRYVLDDGEVGTTSASAIKNALIAGVPLLATAKSPVYDAIPGYPATVDVNAADSFSTLAKELSKFRANTAAARAAPKDRRAALALTVRDAYSNVRTMVPFVALELMYLIRDLVGWQPMLEYVQSLPAELQSVAVVCEQRHLAEAKLGSPFEAIASLEEMIVTLGDTSERQGLIGGRYKMLYDEALSGDRKEEAERYLSLAIEHYEAGMRLDLNDYYPSSNLPRLLRARGDEGDNERACMTAAIAMEACQRRAQINPADSWASVTCLGLAFDEGNVKQARKLANELKRKGTILWHLEATIPDLERSILNLGPNADRTSLQAIVAELRQVS